MCWCFTVSAEAGAGLHWRMSPWAGAGWTVSLCLAGLRSGRRSTVPVVVSARSALQVEGEEAPIRNGVGESLGHGWEWRRGGCDGAAVPSPGEEGQRVLGTAAARDRDGCGAFGALLSAVPLYPRGHRAPSLAGPLPGCPVGPWGAAGSPHPCSVAQRASRNGGRLVLSSATACPSLPGHVTQPSLPTPH